MKWFLYIASLCCSLGLRAQNDSVYLPVKQDGNWYFSRLDGSITSEPYTQEIVILNWRKQSFYALKSEAGYSLYDVHLKPIMLPVFDHFQVNDEYLVVQKRDHLFALSDQLESLPLDADSAFLTDKLLYLYRKGKVGLMAHDTWICKPKFDGITPFNSYHQNQNTDFYLTNENGRYGLIRKNGEELFKPQFQEIQAYDKFLIELIGEHPVYWHRYYQTLIDPKGAPFQFLDRDFWKIYDREHQKANCYYNNKVFGTAFDDVFELKSGYFACKKNGQLGIMDSKENVLLAPKFQHIESISKTHFRYYEGELCGLTNLKGEKLSQAEYHNLQAITEKSVDWIICHKNNKCGLLDSQGKMIFPTEYQGFMIHEQFVLIDVGREFKIGTLDGQILSPNSFKDYEVIWSANNKVICVIGKNLGSNQFFFLNGTKTPHNYTQYFYADNTLKGYYPGGLDILLFDDNGLLLESETHEGTASIVVKNKDESEVLWERPGHYYPSAEYWLDQQSGKIGFKHYRSAGFQVKPSYDLCRIASSGNYIGRHYNDTNVTTAGVIDLNSRYIDDIIIFGSTNIYPVVHSEFFDPLNKINRNTLIPLTHLNGNTQFLYENARTNENKPTYLSDNQERYLRILYDYEAVLCGPNEAQLSLADYFWYNNQHGIRWPGANVEWMQPQKGIKYLGGKVGVHDNYSNDQNSKLKRKLQANERFGAIQMLGTPHTVYERLPGASHGFLIDLKKDSVIATMVQLELERELELIEPLHLPQRFHQVSPIKSWIHPDFPYAAFTPDSNFISFADGFIIYRKKGRFGIQDLKRNEHVQTDADTVIYLGHQLFGLQYQDQWSIHNAQGKQVDTENYLQLDSFQNGIMCYVNSLGCGWRDQSGKGYFMEGFESIANQQGQYLCLIKKGAGSLYNPKGDFVDSLGRREHFFEKHWIIGEDARGTYCRIAAKPKSLVRMGKAYQLFGNYLKTSIGDQLILIDRFGKSTKIGNKKEWKDNEHFLWNYSKKAVNVVPSQGVKMRFKEVKKPVPFDAYLTIEGKDSIFFIDQSGNSIPATAQGEPINKVFGDRYPRWRKASRGYLVQKNELWGAIDENGLPVIPCLFTDIRDLGNGLYEIPGTGTLNILKEDLSFMFPQPVNEITEIHLGNEIIFQVRMGDRVGYCNEQSAWIIPANF